MLGILYPKLGKMVTWLCVFMFYFDFLLCACNCFYNSVNNSHVVHKSSSNATLVFCPPGMMTSMSVVSRFLQTLTSLRLLRFGGLRSQPVLRDSFGRLDMNE